MTCFTFTKTVLFSLRPRPRPRLETWERFIRLMILVTDARVIYRTHKYWIIVNCSRLLLRARCGISFAVNMLRKLAWKLPPYMLCLILHVESHSLNEAQTRSCKSLPEHCFWSPEEFSRAEKFKLFLVSESFCLIRYFQNKNILFLAWLKIYCLLKSVKSFASSSREMRND